MATESIPSGESPPSLPFQPLGWVALWGFWVAVSRQNHPTLLLDAIASALLVAMFAGAVSVNHRLLIPRLRASRRLAAYAGSLLLVLVTLALACTAAIHVLYDLLRGPDPARFGFPANFGMELGLEAVHVLAIAGGAWLIARIGRGPSRWPARRPAG